MARPSAEQRGTARIAVLGADTVAGHLVRHELEQRHVPGGRVDLFGVARDEPLIGEYDGEARLIQQPDPRELQGHDVVFVCQDGSDTDRLAAELARSALVIDTVGPRADEADRPLVHMGVNAPTDRRPVGRVAVPHPLSILLVDLLHPLESAHGIHEATAVVMRPAADFGDAGVEELRQQTVRLLNFEPAPREVFGQQLAFNLIPQRILPGEEAGLENRLVDEVARLLSAPQARLAVRLVAAPIFYGHAVSVRLAFRQPATAEQAIEALAAGGHIRTPPGAEHQTPLQAAGAEAAITVADVGEDGLGGLWLWAVVGEAQAAAARHAVRLADALADL
jgi:aspartate-semialdehyde dehydrogenase